MTQKGGFFLATGESRTLRLHMSYQIWEHVAGVKITEDLLLEKVEIRVDYIDILLRQKF